MSTLDLTGSAHKQRMPTSTGTSNFVERFQARYDYRYMGLAVLAIETAPDTWTITAYPGRTDIATSGDGISADQDINSADHVFYGGRTYTVTGSLATALTNAGYTVT